MANFDFKSITLPDGSVGTVYDTAAQTAVSNVNTNLDNNSYKFLTYKGNSLTEAQIKALTSAKVGDFYIASDSGSAYACITAISGTASEAAWKTIGSGADMSKFVIAEDTTGEIVETLPETFDGHPVADFVLKTEVVNNLSSTSTDVPLSAAMGTNLSDDISDLDGYVRTNTTNITTLQGKVSSLESTVSNKLGKTGGTMTGALIAQNNTNYTTKQVRNVFISTSDPSGGGNGDIWIKYTN